jgi:predicted nucleic acid-binding protein/L-amino acid N-acyltransferase YncA
MRVLLDTNLLIEREDPRIPQSGLPDLLRLLAENGVQVMVHQESVAELRRDQNAARRELTLAKTQAYPVLANPFAVPEEFVRDTGGAVTANDVSDVAILFAVKCDAVSFLLTEDQRLIHRGIRADLADRVMSTRLALDYFRTLFTSVRPSIQRIVRHDPVAAILPFVDGGDPFFDSVTSDYERFREWVHDVAKEGRNCVWIPSPDGKVGALLIYKVENEPLLHLPAARRLKLCTFKVSEKLSRQRISELLLSWGLLYGYQNGFGETYVTVYPRHELLIDFFASFGFTEVGRKGEERVLLKALRAPTTGPTFHPVEYFHRFFPSIRTDGSVRKFLIPVLPEWHSRLFPEYRADRAQTTLDDYGGAAGDLVDPAGNAIRKAYLCNSPARAIRPGDVALFYRSHDVQRVTHLGVIEEARVCKQIDEIVQFVGNRTVLPLSELKALCESDVLAILFWSRGLTRLDRPEGVPLGDDTPWPQSITAIPEEEFHRICG